MNRTTSNNQQQPADTQTYAQNSLKKPPQKRLKVAINGFGRIGRNVLRAYIEKGDYQQVEIVAINDIADSHTLLHLLKYDTAHGRLTTAAEVVADNLMLHLPEATQHIHVLHKQQPSDLPWQQLQVDVVLECTGQFRSYALAKQHVQAGAKQVIIGAAPFDDVDACVVYGVNHTKLTKAQQVISGVSCTTQALVPLIKLLDDAYGLQSAMMTEIHAVTADQCVLDKAHRDLRRARASGQNIIPTTSSSLGALQRVLPHTAGKVEGLSVRVPTLDVAAIDISAVLAKKVTTAEVNAMLREAANHDYASIMRVCDEPLVSSDFIHQPYSLIVDAEQTKAVANQVKVFAWYDNEWGYANRLLDLCLHLAQQR